MIKLIYYDCAIDVLTVNETESRPHCNVQCICYSVIFFTYFAGELFLRYFYQPSCIVHNSIYCSPAIISQYIFHARLGDSRPIQHWVYKITRSVSLGMAGGGGRGNFWRYVAVTLISSDNGIRLDDDVVLQLVSNVRASNLFAYIEYDMTEHKIGLYY